MKKIAVLFVLLLINLSVFAQTINITSNPIVTIFPMLQMEYNIRNIGFGSISAVNPRHDYSSVSFDNPSLMASSNNSWSNYANYHHFGESEHGMALQVGTKISEKLTVGLLSRGYFNNIEYVDPQNQTTEGDINVLTVGGVVGYQLTKNWSLGGGLNYLHYEILTGTELFDFVVNTYYFDFGLNYQKTFVLPSSKKLKFQGGLKANYLGPKPSEVEYLPSNLALAGALTYPSKVNQGILYSTFGYQAEKLLVPTNNFMDLSPMNGIEDHREMSATEAIFASFSDAPNGLEEELQEIIHKFGVELFYEKNGWISGLRSGFFNIPEYKGGMKYRSLGGSLGKNGYMVNVSYQHISNVDATVEERNIVSVGLSMNVGK